jgi:hypothetical protein
MEQLKVKKKDILILNLIVFLILSLLYLFLQYAYRYHLSPFSLDYLRKCAELFWYYIALVLLTSWMLWRHHSRARYFFVLSIFLVAYNVIEGLFIEFNKMIVGSLFFYGVIAYFLYQLFSYYFSQASLNPNYSRDDLFRPMLSEIPCTLSFDSTSIKGYLTNWDEESCFVKLESSPARAPSTISLSINFMGRSFMQSGEVVAHSIDLSGLGIKLGQSTKDLNVFNWAEFTELVLELGFRPERLR